MRDLPFWHGLLFLAAAALSFVLGNLADALGARLRLGGLLLRLLGALAALGRGAAPPLVLVAAFAFLPESWLWVAPVVLVGAAAAVGWTVRDLLADLFAGALLSVEQTLRRGDRVNLEGEVGIVRGVGARVTRVRLDDGRELLVPNHRLLRQGVHVDRSPWPPVTVPVHVGRLAARHGGGHPDTAWVRQRLEELAFLSPYLAPGVAPTVHRAPDTADVWVVHARVVHPRYVDAFRGALVELADEVFGGRDEAGDAPDDG